MEKTGRFYYSEKAAKQPKSPSVIYSPFSRGHELPPVKTFCRLSDGQVVEYTEWVSGGGEPLSQFDDLVYLGRGEFSHTETL